ncbi:MAG: hypothetical protein V1774_01210 [Candidatus Eisenbacteria bacterium]
MNATRGSGLRRGWAAAIVLGALAWLALIAPAGAVTWVGVRYGFSDASGDLFEGSGDLGNGDLVGVHLGLGLLPLIEIEVAGEYVSDELRFEEGVFEGLETAGKADFEDLTLYLTGRFDLLSVPLLPLKGYLGGGMNVHYADVDVEPAEGVSEDLEEAIEDATGQKTRVGWHAVGGVRLGLGGLPAAAFLEGRYSDPFKSDVPHSKSLYAGLSLRF